MQYRHTGTLQITVPAAIEPDMDDVTDALRILMRDNERPDEPSFIKEIRPVKDTPHAYTVAIRHDADCEHYHGIDLLLDMLLCIPDVKTHGSFFFMEIAPDGVWVSLFHVDENNRYTYCGINPQTCIDALKLANDSMFNEYF